MRSHLLPAMTLLLLASACRSQPPDPAQGTQKPTSTESSPPPPPIVTATDASDTDAAEVVAEADAGAAEEPLEGTLFTKQVQGAFRVAGCGGSDDFIPPHVDKQIVDTHCGMLTGAYAEYKKEWLDVAGPFLAKLRPENLPTTLVYPFGGGDLVSALATYPDATDITTVSLEIAGDIRAIDKADNRRLTQELAQLRDHLGKLFLKAHSRTINLDIETRGAVPGEAAYTMAALVIHGYEPTSYRYFAFNSDGTLKWLTDEDIAKNKNQGREGPFANAEIRFRKVGDTSGKVRILRHVAHDLSNASVGGRPGLIKFLESKGKPVSTMTKAASHLLWDDAGFSVIRDYLMTHTEWMISDTTGVPPRIAKKYGFVQDFYGQYEWPEPFGTVNNADATAFHEAFKTAKPISFRYGYPDNKSHGHIVVTHKPEVVTKTPP
ncbi:MAG: hypothetical protein KIT84_26060 [Labilithrix sp.]|nr:hypothetical protein [Labilithrix sp.]MCW5814520.1 hypothetical protein [Labilithrix sp.]